MKTKADVIIVGAGISGTSAAYYCTKRGQSVIVLEENMIGHGGTSRSSGGCRHSGREPRDKPLALFAINNIWSTLKEETGVDPEYTKEGSLSYGWTDDHYKILSTKVEKTKKEGFEAHLLDKKELLELAPWTSDSVQFACYVPTDGHADPMKACLAFYKKARELGCTFITGEKVVRINKVAGKVRGVVTVRGHVYEADKIIVAAAFGSRAIVNTVGIDVPMRNSYVTCWVTEPSPYISGFAYNGMSPTSYYGHQTRNGSWMFGGSGGQEAFFPGTTTSDYNEALQNSINLSIGAVSADIPLIGKLKIVRSWTALTDKCNDEAPVLGPVDGVPGLILYTASCGIGFCIGPAVGYVLSELAADLEPTIDVTSLNLNRFDYMKGNPNYIQRNVVTNQFKW